MFTRFVMLLAFAFYTSSVFASAEDAPQPVTYTANITRCLDHWAGIISDPTKKFAEFLWASDMYSSILLTIKDSDTPINPDNIPVLESIKAKLNHVLTAQVAGEHWLYSMQSTLGKIEYLLTGSTSDRYSFLPQAKVLIDILEGGDIPDTHILYGISFNDSIMSEPFPGILQPYITHGKIQNHPRVLGRFTVFDILSASLWHNFIPQGMPKHIKQYIEYEDLGDDLNALVDFIESAYNAESMHRCCISAEERIALLDQVVAHLKTNIARKNFNRDLDTLKLEELKVKKNDDVPARCISEPELLKSGLSFVVAQKNLASKAETSACIAEFAAEEFVYSAEFHKRCMNSLGHAPASQSLDLLRLMFEHVSLADLSEKEKKVFYLRCKIQASTTLDQLQWVFLQAHEEEENALVMRLTESATMLLVNVYHYYLENGDLKSIDKEIVGRNIVLGLHFDMERKLLFLQRYLPHTLASFPDDFLLYLLITFKNKMYAQAPITYLGLQAEIHELIQAEVVRREKAQPNDTPLLSEDAIRGILAPPPSSTENCYKFIRRYLNVDLIKDESLKTDKLLREVKNLSAESKKASVPEPHKQKMILALIMLCKQQRIDTEIKNLAMMKADYLEALRTSQNPELVALAEEMDAVMEAIVCVSSDQPLSDDLKIKLKLSLGIADAASSAAANSAIDDFVEEDERRKARNIRKREKKKKRSEAARKERFEQELDSRKNKLAEEEARETAIQAQREADDIAATELLAKLEERRIFAEAERVAQEEELKLAQKIAVQNAAKTAPADRLAAEEAVANEAARREREAEDARIENDRKRIADIKELRETERQSTDAASAAAPDAAAVACPMPASVPAGINPFHYFHAAIMNQGTGDNYLAAGVRFSEHGIIEHALFYFEGSLYYSGWVHRITPIMDTLLVIVTSPEDIGPHTQIIQAICHKVSELCSQLSQSYFTIVTQAKVTSVLHKISSSQL